MTEQFISYKLTHLLCEYGLLTTENADYAEQQAQKNNLPLVSYLVKHHFLDCDIIFDACRKHYNMPAANLSEFDSTLLHNGTIDPALADTYHFMPLQKDDHSLQIAISDPTNDHAISAIRFHTGLHIHVLLARESELERMIQTHCRPNILYSQLKSALARIETPVPEPSRHQDDSLNDEPVIHFVNQLLSDAVNKLVSDVHIESFSTYCRIRFRRDGLLYETATLPQSFSVRIITRLKIMASIDIAEKRLPQDGRFIFQHHHNIDIRVSTCPGLHGENIVLRLLRHSSLQLPLDALGMTEQQLTDFQTALQRPQGLILVTGPTGSGKTATLYSALQCLNLPEKNILTVEDPVEIALPGITQVNVNAKIGLDFAAILRTFLRQDPDIMMVGEIRDAETALIAVQAAQTGHLVLSTLHTNSAVDAIKRLLSMHIASSQLAGSLTLIAAQRLVRKLCRHCRPPNDLPVSHDGCEYCRHGYHGRTGIFEVIPVSGAVTQLLLRDADLAQIEAQIHDEAHTSLIAAGHDKFHSGITSYAEVLRVTGASLHVECVT